MVALVEKSVSIFSESFAVMFLTVELIWKKTFAF